MDITINTKFNPNDTAYAYHKGFFTKFVIRTVIIRDYDIRYTPVPIEYLCSHADDNDTPSAITFQERFKENELHTKQELINLLQNLQ